MGVTATTKDVLWKYLPYKLLQIRRVSGTELITKIARTYAMMPTDRAAKALEMSDLARKASAWEAK